MSFFVAGLDLGQARDYSALTIVEAKPTMQRMTMTSLDLEYGRPYEREMEIEGAPIGLDLRWLERYALGTTYPAIVEQVRGRLAQLPGAVLAVDATGVGRAVVDLFHDAGVPLVAVTITGGAVAAGEGRDWNVPKRDLVHGLLVAFQEQRFRASQRLQLAATLIQELTSFELRVNARTGNDSYEVWREGAHDDLVLACAIACWVAEQEVAARSALARVDAFNEAFNADPVRIGPF